MVRRAYTNLGHAYRKVTSGRMWIAQASVHYANYSANTSYLFSIEKIEIDVNINCHTRTDRVHQKR